MRRPPIDSFLHCSHSRQGRKLLQASQSSCRRIILSCHSPAFVSDLVVLSMCNVHSRYTAAVDGRSDHLGAGQCHRPQAIRQHNDLLAFSPKLCSRFFCHKRDTATLQMKLGVPCSLRTGRRDIALHIESGYVNWCARKSDSASLRHLRP